MTTINNAVAKNLYNVKHQESHSKKMGRVGAFAGLYATGTAAAVNAPALGDAFKAVTNAKIEQGVKNAPLKAKVLLGIGFAAAAGIAAGVGTITGKVIGSIADKIAAKKAE